MKYAQVNQVRHEFDIATISNCSKKIRNLMSIPYYTLLVFCPYILSAASPSMLSGPPCILCYALSIPSTYYPSSCIYRPTPLLHSVRPPLCTVHTWGGEGGTDIVYGYWSVTVQKMSIQILRLKLGLSNGQPPIRTNTIKLPVEVVST